MRPTRFFLFVMFFFSGAAGLVYQIIWGRMLYLVFGVSTYSVVAVTSGFMAGLALGSALVGKLLTPKVKPLRLYAAIEAVIGLTAAITPFTFKLLPPVYVAVARATPDATTLLVFKFLLVFVAILPSTIAMGATLPVIVHYLQTRTRHALTGDVALLYAVNTLGGVCGVVVTGYVLIERIGLSASALAAALVNLALAAAATLLSRLEHDREIARELEKEAETSDPAFSYPLPHAVLMLAVFAVSGMVSMALEIAWTRMLTPLTGTYVYAFSFILAVILAGIAAGSFIHRILFARQERVMFLYGAVLTVIGLCASASVVATSSVLSLSPLLTQLFVLAPAAVAMGMTFPTVASLIKNRTAAGAIVGAAYAVNTVGSMAGPIIAGFVLLPVFGTNATILLLAAVDAILGAMFVMTEPKYVSPRIRYAFAAVPLATILALILIQKTAPSMFLNRNLKEAYAKTANPLYVGAVAEDETAHVLAYRKKDNTDYNLMTDGSPMSVLVDETKLMAHLPILAHPDPRDMLVICFGMGTTYRSSLSYGINVDAVELVRTVPEMLPIFFADADAVRANPKGRIIINDGRNYLKTTTKTYDIVQADPPPPVNASGTTVLYSREFYEDAKKVMKPGGMFMQWMFYGTRADDFKMLVKSFTDAFRYVAVFHSPRQIGIYLIGSESPIPKVDGASWEAKLGTHPAAYRDVTEWGPWDGYKLASLYWSDRDLLTRFAGNAPAVTDDRPQTEYFLLRQRETYYNIARDEVVGGKWPEK